MFDDIHNKMIEMLPGIIPFLNAMNQTANIQKEYSGQLNVIMNSNLVPLIEKNAMTNDIKNSILPVMQEISY